MKTLLCYTSGLVCLFALTGCHSETSAKLDGPVPSVQARADEAAKLVVPDPGDLVESLEASAKLRRDGNGNIIEVDLRGANVGELPRRLAELPKLRSVLLSDSDAGDEAVEGLSEIKTLENLDLRGCDIGDAALGSLQGLGKLKSFKLSGKGEKTRVTDEGVKKLAALKSLRVLALDFLPISDQGVESLSAIPQLKELYLAGTRVTNDSGSTLGGLTELSKLRLAGTDFGTAGVESLSALTRLTELDLSDCAGIDQEVLGKLAAFPHLTKLNLYQTSVGDSGWVQLEALDSLVWLNVDNTEVNDGSLADIGQLSGLTFLHLGSTTITDAGLENLTGLKRLQRLIVTRTQVTEDGVAALQAELPETEIQRIYVPGK